MSKSGSTTKIFHVIQTKEHFCFVHQIKCVRPPVVGDSSPYLRRSRTAQVSCVFHSLVIYCGEDRMELR